MSDFHESKIVLMIGAIDGNNKIFKTPTAYKSGSIRVLWNGNVYEETDDRFGWVEIDDSTIETKEAPKVRDLLSCFYQELSPVPGVSNVVGSPFDPTGNYP